MKKLVFFLLMFLMLGASATGRVDQRVVVTDSLTDNQTDPSYTSEFDVGDYSSFILWFRCTQADTSKDDSVTITLQGKSDMGEWGPYWETVLAFAEADFETLTLCHVFSYDSLAIAKYQFHDALRFQIDFTDTCTDQDSDSAQFLPESDDYAAFFPSTGSDNFAVIDEVADVDSSDYLQVKEPGAAHEDSIEMLGVTDHYYDEVLIDSVVMRFAGEWLTDSAFLAWGVCLADTDDCTWAQDTSLGTGLADSAYATYSTSFATAPGGAAWTRANLDDLVMVFMPVRIKGSGYLRIYWAWTQVYHTKGGASPTYKYKIKVKGWD